jgi:hypothetical protein
MASMNSLISIGGMLILAVGAWYVYKKGYLDDIVGKLGDLTGGSTEPAIDDPCIAECATKSKMAYYDYDYYGFASKKKDDKKKEEPAAKCDCSKYETPIDTPAAVPETPAPVETPKDEIAAIVAAAGDCKKKFGGKCDSECKSKKSSKCKDCEKACGTSSKLALAYMGSYYDGQVMDSAYYVTGSSFIPRTSSNYGIAIA